MWPWRDLITWCGPKNNGSSLLMIVNSGKDYIGDFNGRGEERSWFKNYGDESEGDDGENIGGGAGVSEINLGALGGTDGLSSNKTL